MNAFKDLLKQIALACLATITAVVTRWLYDRLTVPGGFRA